MERKVRGLGRVRVRVRKGKKQSTKERTSKVEI